MTDLPHVIAGQPLSEEHIRVAEAYVRAFNLPLDGRRWTEAVVNEAVDWWKAGAPEPKVGGQLVSDEPWGQRTVIQTHDPADGDRYVPVLTMEGVTLPLVSPPALTIDGEPWFAVRRTVAIDTQTRTVVTTITVIRDN